MAYKDKEKQKEYQREWMRKRRAEFFSDKKCKHCNSIEELELHHRDPDQKVNHAIWSWKESRRLIELAKCDVLCNECHKKETKKQLSVIWEHGTSYGYRTHGCRCDLCREAQKLYMREYRASKK